MLRPSSPTFRQLKSNEATRTANHARKALKDDRFRVDKPLSTSSESLDSLDSFPVTQSQEDQGSTLKRKRDLPAQDRASDSSAYHCLLDYHGLESTIQAQSLERPTVALYPIDHPIPFVGLGQRHDGDLYKRFGLEHANHPNIPERPNPNQKSVSGQLDFDVLDVNNYVKYGRNSRGITILKLSKRLHGIMIGFTGRSRMNAWAAVMCTALLQSTDQFARVLPVRFTQFPTDRIEYQNYAAAITTRAGAEYIIPLIFRFIITPGRGDYFLHQGWSQRAILTRAVSSHEREILKRFHDHFAGCPAIVARDCEFIGLLSTGLTRPESRYTHVWSIRDQLDDGIQVPRADLDDEMFDQVGPLGRRVVELARTIQWKKQRPGQPFDRLDPADFSFNSSALSSRYERAVVSGKRPRNILVNGEVTCEISRDCTLRPTAGSLCCQYHTAAIHKFFATPTAALDISCKLACSLLPLPGKDRLKVLKAWYPNPTKAWIVDTEFLNMLTGTSAIPMSISIRDIRGKEVITTLVGYKMSLTEFLTAVTPRFSPETAAFMTELARQTFRKNYAGLSTKGPRPSTIAEKIRVAGYSSEHILLSWGTSVDLKIFHKLLKGDDGLLVEDSSVGTVLNVMRLCKDMLPSTFPTMKLGVVHRVLCPKVQVHELP